MRKITFGAKGYRLKWHLYFFGLALVIILGTCRILSHINWSAVQRSAFEDNVHEMEKQVVAQHPSPGEQVDKFRILCGERLRNGWLSGYLYSEADGKEHFIGRIPPPAFRKAVETQAALIKAGKPFDEEKIPGLRAVVELNKIRCRLLVAEGEPPPSPTR
ncbi:hypothetical protein FJY63_11840 [Candidatus Sumerlaeota bacterium]|nr:hypothetical protein [Candidatus Sumerlaeota bacterium]